MKSFRDINIVFPDGVRKGSITFDERSILSFEASENALSLPEGVYLAPGFLDEHIHGACGRDAMDGEPESILRIADALVQEGVTSFLPTTMTETIPAIEKSLLSIQEAKKKQENKRKQEEWLRKQRRHVRKRSTERLGLLRLCYALSHQCLMF